MFRRDQEYFEKAVAKQLEFAGDAGVYEDRLVTMFLEGATDDEVAAFWRALESLVAEGWIVADVVSGQKVYRRWPG